MEPHHPLQCCVSVCLSDNTLEMQAMWSYYYLLKGNHVRPSYLPVVSDFKGHLVPFVWYYKILLNISKVIQLCQMVIITNK